MSEQKTSHFLPFQGKVGSSSRPGWRVSEPRHCSVTQVLSFCVTWVEQGTSSAMGSVAAHGSQDGVQLRTSQIIKQTIRLRKGCQYDVESPSESMIL